MDAPMWTLQALASEGYMRACGLNQVPALMPLKLTLEGHDVLVCKDACGVFAVDELCPHQLKSMAYGIVMEGTLTCPHHQYRFDLDTGRPSVRRCAPLKTYPVVVHDQQVWVKVA